MFLVMLLGWAISLLITYWITRLAVSASISELAAESRGTRELLLRLIDPVKPAPKPVVVPSEPSPEDLAKALFKVGEDQQFALNFTAARLTYAALVERFPNTRQAARAMQQLENLRNA